MGNLNLFLKSNKKQREKAVYKATASLTDENDIPLDWVIRPITTDENEEIREASMYEKDGRYVLNVSKYTAKLLAASVSEPNLYSAELQDSYGVKTPEGLLKAMLDNPGEYNALAEFVKNLNSFPTFAESVEQAKN
jgi:hypothetical protein